MNFVFSPMLLISYPLPLPQSIYYSDKRGSPYLRKEGRKERRKERGKEGSREGKKEEKNVRTCSLQVYNQAHFLAMGLAVGYMGRWQWS